MGWQEREARKFADGTYQYVPWQGEQWWVRSDAAAHHFAHVSEDDGSKLAYTPDDRFGREDRQLRTKPGRYLNKFFGKVLTPKEVAHWSGEFAAANEEHSVGFARTADEIEALYRSADDSGVGACMSHAAGEYSGPCHPVRVYGAGDLAVAYLGTAEHPTARVLVREEPKAYGRVYGDEARMRGALERMGFEPDGSGGRGFDGAKLDRIDARSGFVMPYLDHGYGVSDCGDHFTMAQCGRTYDAQETTGVINGCTCNRCDCAMGEDESFCVGNESWCEDCYCEHARTCHKCEETVHKDYATLVGDEWYCDGCVSDVSFQCEKCHDRFLDDEGNTVDESETWCGECVSEYAFYCDSCGECFEGSYTESADVDGETWCEHCRSKDATECSCGKWVPDGDAIGGRCEECHEEHHRADPDQLPLLGPGPVVAGPGEIWVPTGATGQLWCDSVTVHPPGPGGRTVRSGGEILWGWSEAPIGLTPEECEARRLVNVAP